DEEICPDRADMAPGEAIDDIAGKDVLPGREDRPVAELAIRKSRGADRDGAGPAQRELRDAGGFEVPRPRDVAIRVSEEPSAAVSQEAQQHGALAPGVPARDPQLDDIAEAVAAPPRSDERIEQADQPVLQAQVHRPRTRGTRR